jgi:flavin reductase (DIM6/NTAB) family NADH-FMN oxidoreductase RutF/rubredoxin
MDITALFTITYGLFIAGVERNGKKNGCIINTAIQVTDEPNRISVTMRKSNYTTQLIRKKGSLAISVLSLDYPLESIKSFGMRSGRECEKFDDVEHKIDINGNPYIEKNTLAYMSLNVSSIIDLDTHYMFICDVVDVERTEKGQPMTYADYRKLRTGETLDKAVDKPVKKSYVCSVCHYVYDGEIPFEDLPDDYVCPVCGQPKSVFIEVIE